MRGVPATGRTWRSKALLAAGIASAVASASVCAALVLMLGHGQEEGIVWQGQTISEISDHRCISALSQDAVDRPHYIVVPLHIPADYDDSGQAQAVVETHRRTVSAEVTWPNGRDDVSSVSAINAWLRRFVETAASRCGGGLAALRCVSPEDPIRDRCPIQVIQGEGTLFEGDEGTLFVTFVISRGRTERVNAFETVGMRNLRSDSQRRGGPVE